MKICWLPLAIALLMPLAIKVSATIHYVDLNSTNPVVPYTSWETAATNIQDAVFPAGTGDTDSGHQRRLSIWRRGDFLGIQPRFCASTTVTVQSVNGPSVTMIQGNWDTATNGAAAVRCVYLATGSTLSGFTLTNGATATSGAAYGGGVFCQSTNCVVTNCVITGNSAYAYSGGAYQGTLVNCALIGNSAPHNGWGGGASGSILINCLLARNFAGYIGGGANSSTLINCTVVSNSAAAYAGSLSGCSAINSIVYYNSSYLTNDDVSSGYTFTNCCLSFYTPVGANNITNPPVFANLAGGDFHLNAASPCINAGNNALVASTSDLDGNPRIVAGEVDIGAYEFQAPVHYVKPPFFGFPLPTPVSPFTNWLTAATNIQDAIDAAVAGDFIVVSNGVYNSGGRAVHGTATNRVTVDKEVTVQSVNGPGATIIVGSQVSVLAGIRCAYLTNGAMLIGFTLTNGGTIARTGDIFQEESGAGVWCESSDAIVSNCILSGNVAYQYGGGAFQGTLVNCIVTNNRANFGGGGCSNMLINCTLTKNLATYQNVNSGGGAIYSTLTDCLVVNNTCYGGGGGAGFSSLTSCIVSNNTGNSIGGGVCMGIATDCLISGNQTFNSGGGAYSNILNNCALQNNSASLNGGGAYGSSLRGCVVSNNFAQTGGGAYGSTWNNCLVVSNRASASGGGGYGGIFTNCTIAVNGASTSGGGVYRWHGGLVV